MRGLYFLTTFRRARFMTMLGSSGVELPDRRPHPISSLRLGESSAPHWPSPVACTASQRGNTSVTSRSSTLEATIPELFAQTKIAQLPVQANVPPLHAPRVPPEIVPVVDMVQPRLSPALPDPRVFTKREARQWVNHLLTAFGIQFTGII